MKTYFVVYLYQFSVVHTFITAKNRNEVISILKGDDQDVVIQSITVIETK